MALTYGMIGDRLSDLVAELEELCNGTTDYHRASEMANVIGDLIAIRKRCDAKVMEALTK